MENLILEKNFNKLYLEEITYNLERVRDYLKTNLSNFSLLESDNLFDFIDLFNHGSYFSLYELKGFFYENDEIQARKKLMDLLKFFKDLFKELFAVETLEAKKIIEQEEYSLLLVGHDRTIELLSLKLMRKDNYVTLISLDNFKEKISNLFDLNFNNLYSFSSSLYQIGFSLIQNNKPEVNKAYHEIVNLISYKSILLGKKSYLDLESGFLKMHIPFLIEIGPSNLKKHQVTLISQFERKQINIDDFKMEIKKSIEENQKLFYQKSLKLVIDYQKKINNLIDLKDGNRFCLCDDSNCFNKVQEQVESNKLYHSFSNLGFTKKCIVCNKPSKNIIFIVK